MNMKYSEKTKAFIQKLITSGFEKTAELIKQDTIKIAKDVTKMVLRNSIQFEGKWTDYILTDVNVSYDEDMLKVNDMLNMYGIRKDLPVLKADDRALIIGYQFTLVDAFGGTMDIVNIFHTTIKGSVGDDDFINRWFILSD